MIDAGLCFDPDLLQVVHECERVSVYVHARVFLPLTQAQDLHLEQCKKPPSAVGVALVIEVNYGK